MHRNDRKCFDSARRKLNYNKNKTKSAVGKSNLADIETLGSEDEDDDDEQ